MEISSAQDLISIDASQGKLVLKNDEMKVEEIEEETRNGSIDFNSITHIKKT